MKALDAMKEMAAWDKRGRLVFSASDLRKIFPEKNEKTFSEGLRRLVAQGVLQRAARGVYVNPNGQSTKTHLLEKIAVCFRRGEYNYLSLESALSEYGVISQIPMGQITVMTTGRAAKIKTPFGQIEFTHTARSAQDILENTCRSERPLRIAKVDAALRDLKRVGRNMHMVSVTDYQDVLKEVSR